MGWHAKAPEGLLEDMDGPVLVGLGNWLVESLDVSELENEQVLLLFMLLVRALDALQKEYSDILLPLMTRLVMKLEQDDET